MRTFSTVAAVAVVLALGGAALADAHKPGNASRAKTLEFFAPLAQLELIDLGDTGFSLGDESVFSDDLLTEQNGKSAGIDGGVCTVVRVADAGTQSGTLQCIVTFSLKRGQITTQGLAEVINGQFAGTAVAAITGGTGRFRKAAGESEVGFLEPGQANVTLTILR